MLFGLFLFLFPDFAVSLFIENSESMAVHALGTGAMMLASTAYAVRWISVCTQCFMSAIGRPVFAASISVSAAFVFPLILIIALHPMGLDGIWLNLPGTALLTALLSIFILTRYKGIVRDEISGRRTSV